MFYNLKCFYHPNIYIIMKRIFFLILCIALVSANNDRIYSQPAEGYYRFPALCKDLIVFTAEGDLWKITREGGIAQRLTTHQGQETNACISPDGKLIAFSAEYEGAPEVYTMSVNGGLPKRITYEGDNAIVVGWTPDGEVLYTTSDRSTLPNNQLVRINPANLDWKLIPLSQASDGAYSPDNKTIYFTRLSFQGSHTKRYKGGTAQNIWKFTSGSDEALPLTGDYPGTSKTPMWYNGNLFFASDRDGTMNIWSMDTDGKNLAQHTEHKYIDIQSPNISGNEIIYQLGADLWIYNIESDQSVKVPVSLASDFDQKREKWIKNPQNYLSGFDISEEGDYIALNSRGRVFSAPAKQGRFVEVTRKYGIRYKAVRFLPGTSSIIMLSDESGEMEFWKAPLDGIGEPEQLTKDSKVLINYGVPSPDGKYIAYHDKDLQLWIYNINNKASELVEISDQDGFGDMVWSPDNNWLAYVEAAENQNNQIKIYSMKTGDIQPITTDRLDSYNPAWSPDGKWIYFLSDRVFEPKVYSTWGPRQPEPYFEQTTKIFMVSLQEDLRFPFIEEDELYKDDKDTTKSDKSDDGKIKNIKIDFEGLQARLFQLPVKAGNYRGLSATEDHIYYTEYIPGEKSRTDLMALKITNIDPKPETIVSEIGSYTLSGNKKKILLRKSQDLYVINADGSAQSKLDDKKVKLDGWTFLVDPVEEWKQIFTDAWRMERDYFYDKNLHGVDWKGIYKRYFPLVDRITDRYELNDLIAQVVSELSALHIFVGGGDVRTTPDNIRPSSLGAVLIKDPDNEGYRVDHIYKSDPDYPDELSPLARNHSKIKTGDFITHINGVSILSVDHPSELLRRTEGKQVRLTLKSHGKTYEEIVKPITIDEESDLRYREWEYLCRSKVEEKSKGSIGYLHLRAMGAWNYTEFVKNFYPVYDRQGLIIDVRHNNGGNIDSWILEKLIREAWFYWQPRAGAPYWNMQYAFRGHMVVLCDENTASDGEAFAEGFRRLGLGKVIGTRTWGGEIWLSGENVLVDWGRASAAMIGVYGPDGQWLIEGHGVVPDIVIDNLPHSTFNGKDAQLDAAIEHLQKLIKEDPRLVPEHPPYPDKSFRYE
jgi:tricorn protease